MLILVLKDALRTIFEVLVLVLESSPRPYPYPCGLVLVLILAVGPYQSFFIQGFFNDLQQTMG